MKKFRLGIILFAVAMIIGQLIIFDYSHLSWSNNSGGYLGILSMIFLIAAMILSNRDENEHS